MSLNKKSEDKNSQSCCSSSTISPKTQTFSIFPRHHINMLASNLIFVVSWSRESCRNTKYHTLLQCPNQGRKDQQKGTHFLLKRRENIPRKTTTKFLHDSLAKTESRGSFLLQEKLGK